MFTQQQTRTLRLARVIAAKSGGMTQDFVVDLDQAMAEAHHNREVERLLLSFQDGDGQRLIVELTRDPRGPGWLFYGEDHATMARDRTAYLPNTDDRHLYEYGTPERVYEVDHLVPMD